MENPEARSETQKAIADAIAEHEKSVQEGRCGVSLATAIYNKLLEKGYLRKRSS